MGHKQLLTENLRGHGHARHSVAWWGMSDAWVAFVLGVQGVYGPARLGPRRTQQACQEGWSKPRRICTEAATGACAFCCAEGCLGRRGPGNSIDVGEEVASMQWRNGAACGASRLKVFDHQPSGCSIALQHDS